MSQRKTTAEQWQEVERAASELWRQICVSTIIPALVWLNRILQRRS